MADQTYTLSLTPKQKTAYHIRLTPQLLEALNNAQEKGGASCTLRQNSAGNTIITVGGQEFPFNAVGERHVELVKLPSTHSPGAPCTVVGLVTKKLQFQRKTSSQDDSPQLHNQYLQQSRPLPAVQPVLPRVSADTSSIPTKPQPPTGSTRAFGSTGDLVSLGRTLAAGSGNTTSPVEDPAPAQQTFVVTPLVRAAAKRRDLRLVLIAILSERELGSKGLQKALTEVARAVHNFRQPVKEDYAHILELISDFRSPGKYVLKKDRLRELEPVKRELSPASEHSGDRPTGTGHKRPRDGDAPPVKQKKPKDPSTQGVKKVKKPSPLEGPKPASAKPKKAVPGPEQVSAPYVAPSERRSWLDINSDEEEEASVAARPNAPAPAGAEVRKPPKSKLTSRPSADRLSKSVSLQDIQSIPASKPPKRPQESAKATSQQAIASYPSTTHPPPLANVSNSGHVSNGLDGTSPVSAPGSVNGAGTAIGAGSDYQQGASNGTTDDLESEAWVAEYADHPPRAVEACTSVDQFKAYHNEFSEKYRVYFRLHKRISRYQASMSALQQSIEASPSEDDRQRWSNELQKVYKAKHGRAQRWNAAFINLHTELEAIKQQLHEFHSKYIGPENA